MSVFIDLPEETILQILSFLDPQALSRSQQVIIFPLSFSRVWPIDRWSRLDLSKTTHFGRKFSLLRLYPYSPFTRIYVARSAQG